MHQWFKRRPVAGAVGLLMAGVLAGCGGDAEAGQAVGPPVVADAAAWEELEKAANSEGRITAYISLTGTEPVLEDFKRDYPEIDVTIEQVPTADLIARLDQELSVDAAGADIAFHASPGWFVDRFAADDFAALQLGPEVQEADWEERLEGNSFATVYGFPHTLAHRTSAAKPQSLKQLLDSNPNAKIGLVDPRVSPAISNQYRALQEAYGDEFLDKLAEADVTIEAANPQLTEGLAAGNYDYAFPDIASITNTIIEKGAPLEIVTPADEGLAGPVYNVAIPRTAENSNAAQVLVNWMMSERGATSFSKHLQPATVPIQVEGSIPWGEVQTFDPADWTTDKSDAWIAENWTPRFR